MDANSEKSVLVYDVGGSHVSTSVCFAEGYRLGPVVTGHHEDCRTAEAFVGLLHSLGEKATEGAAGTLGAGLAMPGPFDYAAGVSWMRHKLPYLYGIDLRQALAETFGWQARQVHFVNDAAAYLLGEVGAGAARGVPRVVGITLGTGIGSAFAIDGRIVTESFGVPMGGEIWNLPYKDRTVEDFLSTRAIKQSYRERTGQEREVAAIAANAENDPAASAVFTDFGHNLGLALRSLLHQFAPDIVVLGGGISRSAHLFLPAAEQQLKGLTFQLRVSTLGDHAPLVGAAVALFSGSKGFATIPAGEPVQAKAR